MANVIGCSYDREYDNNYRYQNDRYFASDIVTIVVVTFQWVNECIVFNYSHVIFNCIKNG